MSIRDELLDEYGRADTTPLGTLADLRNKLDAYRAEVLAEGAERKDSDLKSRVTRAIHALKAPTPGGSQHYRSGWGDGVDAAIDAARDTIEGGAR